MRYCVGECLTLPRRISWQEGYVRTQCIMMSRLVSAGVPISDKLLSKPTLFVGDWMATMAGETEFSCLNLCN